MDETATQRLHDLCAIFNALRWIVRTGALWRMLPHDLPPWAAVYRKRQNSASALLFRHSSSIFSYV
jgi:transposase